MKRTALATALIIPVLCAACAQTSQQARQAGPRDTVVLFDGSDLKQWMAENGRTPRWEIDGDTLHVLPGAGGLVTRESYGDFVLHVEFKLPESPPEASGQGRGNSGVYLQRRYEVQILDSAGDDAGDRDCGALYGMRAPDRNVCKQPGEWQTFDITFRMARWKNDGRTLRKVENARITVLHNGVAIHNDVELEDKTGRGWPEGPEPGPILLQDHGHAVQFRNIWLLPRD